MDLCKFIIFSSFPTFSSIIFRFFFGDFVLSSLIFLGLSYGSPSFSSQSPKFLAEISFVFDTFFSIGFSLTVFSISFKKAGDALLEILISYLTGS